MVFRSHCRLASLTASRSSDIWPSRVAVRLLATHTLSAHRLEQPPTTAAAPLTAVPQRSNVNDRLLQRFRQVKKSANHDVTTLPSLLHQYDTRAGKVLDALLPNGSLKPSGHEDGDAGDFTLRDGVVTVAHILEWGEESPADVLLATGFFIQPLGGLPYIVTCAHTLEQARQSHRRNMSKGGSPTSGTLFFTDAGDVFVASEILSSLPRVDLVLFAIHPPNPPLSTQVALPVCMYPARPDTPITARFFHDHHHGDASDGIGGYGRWCEGKVDGYRDWAGREAEPGTYDTLSHLIFSPPPTPGTSGGPILDKDTGHVVGVVTGSRMYNRVKGLKGWGTPSEAIFEMFSLPIARRPA